jgi:hypothetical protein
MLHIVNKGGAIMKEIRNLLKLVLFVNLIGLGLINTSFAACPTVNFNAQGCIPACPGHCVQGCNGTQPVAPKCWYPPTVEGG